jgi:hypothetical protein
VGVCLCVSVWARSLHPAAQVACGVVMSVCACTAPRPRTARKHKRTPKKHVYHTPLHDETHICLSRLSTPLSRSLCVVRQSSHNSDMRASKAAQQRTLLLRARKNPAVFHFRGLLHVIDTTTTTSINTRNTRVQPWPQTQTSLRRMRDTLLSSFPHSRRKHRYATRSVHSHRLRVAVALAGSAVAHLHL